MLQGKGVNWQYEYNEEKLLLFKELGRRLVTAIGDLRGEYC